MGCLAALVPPPRANLVRHFGVFAPNARVRFRIAMVMQNGFNRR